MYPLFLEVQLNDNLPMGIRHPVNSAPYAQLSGTAESLFADVTIQTSDGEYLQVVDETGKVGGAAYLSRLTTSPLILFHQTLPMGTMTLSYPNKRCWILLRDKRLILDPTPL